MRPIDLGVVVAMGLSSFAVQASPRGGDHGSGGGGGGPLSRTSSGLGDAARRGGGGGSSGPIVTTTSERDTVYVEDTRAPPLLVDGVIIKRRVRRPGPPMPTAHFEGYVGASKVVDSDESVSAEIGVVDDWFRIDGSYTRYYEAQQPGMDMLQLSLPKLTGGVRGYEHDAKLYITGGVVGAKTRNDPTMNSSFVGAVAGARLETPLNDLASLVGTAELFIFSDHVTATSVVGGVKVGPLAVSLRVLDFNVGPALWGPEVGLRF